MSDESKATWPWVLGITTLVYAGVGWLAVQLPGTLLLLLHPAAWLRTLVQGFGLGLFAALWILSLQQARRTAARALARASAPRSAPVQEGGPDKP